MTGSDGSTYDAAELKLLIQRSGRFMIAPLPANLDTHRAETLCEIVVAAVRAESPQAVIFDASSVQLMDSLVADCLNRAGRMIRVLGSKAFLSGLPPVLCSTLVQLDVRFPDLTKTGNLDHAFESASRCTTTEDP